MAKKATKKATKKTTSKVAKKATKKATSKTITATKKVSTKATKKTAKKAKSPGEQQIDEFQLMNKLLATKEDLLPELKEYWHHRGTQFEGIYHPLFQSSAFHDDHFAYVNYEYRERVKYLQKLRRKKNYYLAVFCYSTKYLLDGFYEEIGGADDKTYWKVLGAVWVQSESLWVNREILLGLLSGTRPDRDYLMNEDERTAFKDLPHVLKIYRGFSGNRGKGLSWTLDKDKAVWFASRFHEMHGKPGRVIEGTCHKSDVLAYFTGRGESEIVIDPDKVKRQKPVLLKR